MDREKLLEKLDRENDSHKGENGKVGIIAGSKDFSGPPAFNAEASLRSGADLVKILTSDKVKDVVRSYSENYIIEGYKSDYFTQEALEKAKRLDKWSDVVVLGSGLSDPDKDVLKQFSKNFDSSLVVDAEAIRPLVSEGVKAVYAPHSGEKEVIEEHFDSLKAFCKETGSTVVVTGSVDKIYTQEGVFENETGHPCMTVGGTGDLLAGLIGSLMAQGLDPVEASILGAWINGKAGQISSQEYGRGTTAKDIVDKIPEAFNGL